MRKLVGALAGAMTFALAAAARAEDTSLEGLLSQEVVTSVSHAAESSQDAPALTRSISAEEIRRYGMTSVAEALDFLGFGVHVEHGLAGSELTVRGVSFTGDRGNHVLILVDGLAVNEPLYGDAPIDQRLGVPLEMIDHIELVLGPGSAIYGTNAVLAVVNVVTKSAKTLAGMHVVAEASAQRTARTTLTMARSFDLLGKRAELVAGLGYYAHHGSIALARQELDVDPQTNQPTYWGGVADDTFRTDVPSAYMRLTRAGLEISAHAVVAAVGDPSGAGDFDRPESGSLSRRARLGAAQTFALGRVGELTATVYAMGYANSQKDTISRRLTCPGICTYRERESSNRVGTDVRANLDWLENGKVVTALGANASLDHVAADDFASDYETGAHYLPLIRTIAIDSVLNLAANGQQTLRPFRWLDLVGGARVDWRKISESGGSNRTFTPVVTPRLALAARPWNGATVKGIYAEAFRAPNPYEVDARQVILVPSNGLQPERTRSVEAIFEQRVGAQRLSAGVFRTRYSGIVNRELLSNDDARAAYLAGLTLIPPGTTSPIYQYRADNDVDAHGFSAGVDGALLEQKLRYGASFTGSRARNADVQRIPVAPQVSGNARVSYDLGGKLPTAALAASFAGEAASDRGASSGYRNVTFAPPALELRATLTGLVPWVKGLSYRAIFVHQTHESTPFAVGPTLRARTGTETAPLTPTQPWNVFLGLAYDFGG